MSTALITGASRGLGRALATALLRDGFRVAGVARDEAPLRAALEAIGGHVIVDDVGDPDAAARIAGQALAELGRVDLLVHNASTLGAVPLPLLADMRPEDVARAFEVNVLGPFRLTRLLVGPMLLRGHGTIVWISSDAARNAYPNWGAYDASKAALEHMARTFAAELEGTGVRSLVLDPGEMDTRMHADALPDADPVTLLRPEDAATAVLAALLGEGVHA